MHRSSRRTLAATAVALAATTATAHEFWIEPPGPVAVGEPVPFELRVGDGFPGETYPRDPAHVVDFELIGPDGRRLAIPGRRGAQPAGVARVVEAGTHVALYRSRSTRTVLEGDVFQRYLREEGLDAIAEARERAGLADRSASERFSRCAKTVFAAGAPGGDLATRPAGLRFELVPDRDPLAIAPGDTLAVRALLDGRPASGVRLHAFRRGATGAPTGARTDADGRASFTLDAAGTWMLAGVHMEPGADGGDAEWRSEWASLTFVLNAGR